MPTVRCEVTVVNRWGLHARSAMRFVQTATMFTSSVHVSASGLPPVDGKDVMDLLSLGAPPGTTLSIEADGDDAEEAVALLVRLVENGFGEDRAGSEAE